MAPEEAAAAGAKRARWARGSTVSVGSGLRLPIAAGELSLEDVHEEELDTGPAADARDAAAAVVSGRDGYCLGSTSLVDRERFRRLCGELALSAGKPAGESEAKEAVGDTRSAAPDLDGARWDGFGVRPADALPSVTAAGVSGSVSDLADDERDMPEADWLTSSPA